MEEKNLEEYEESASAATTEASEDNTDKIPAKKRIAAEALDWFDTVTQAQRMAFVCSSRSKAYVFAESSDI